MDDKDSQDFGDGSDMADGEDGDGPAKQDDYQKKEYSARPYTDGGETEKAVEDMIVKNAR